MVHLNETFAALSDETRRAILARLMRGETPLSELAEPFDMSLTGVSNHVRVLSDAGLLNVEKRGRTRYCSLNAQALKAADDWFDDYRGFWAHQLDNMAQVLMDERK